MRRILVFAVGWIMLVFLIAGTLIVLDMVRPTVPTSVAPAAAALPQPKKHEVLEMTARVVPVQSVELDFPGKGTGDGIPVREVSTREGSIVKKGDVLARLDTRDLQLRVQTAHAVLAQARAEHDQLQATINEAKLDAEVQFATLRSDADAAMLRADADAAKLRADAANARASGRISVAEALEAAAQSLKRANAELQANVKANEEKRTSALAAAGTANIAAITAAQAKVQQAEIALKREQLALDRAVLRSPIDGTVIDVNIDVGEVVNQAAPAIVVADVSSWQIEADTATDLSVTNIMQGAPVKITFNALPDVTIPGKVTHVKTGLASSPDQHERSYTVIVTPEHLDQRVRWNMLATVALDTK